MNLIDLPKQSGKPLPATAISYLRFSGIRQSKGDSTRRQNSGADKFTEITGIEIAQRLEDLGLSAWTGKHVAKGALGEFLKQIRTDEFQAKVKSRDVFLVVENLDRLSREAIDDAFVQFRDIVRSGVKVVTMMDQKVFDDKSIKDMATVITSIVTMARAHEESQDKSNRICEVWDEMRKKAQAGKIISKRVPYWLTVSEDGKRFETIPQAVKAVRRVFALTLAGNGLNKIATIMNSEGVPTLFEIKKTKTGTYDRQHTMWNGSSIIHLLKTKAVIGTCVFKKAGNVEMEIENYFPVIIDPATRAKALKQRNAHPTQRGRTSKRFTNLFRKIAVDAETGEAMHTNGVYKDANSKCYLVPKGVKLGQRKGSSWRVDNFEAIFFLTVQRALSVEGSTAKEEDALALVEVELEKVGKAIGNLVAAITNLGDREITAITDELALLEDRKTELLLEKERLGEAILAGAGSLQLDPKEADRGKLAQALQANVERIEMNCETKSFHCQLMNGIKYDVTWNEGEVVLNSKDFKPQKTVMAFDHKRILKVEQVENLKTLRKILKKS